METYERRLPKEIDGLPETFSGFTIEDATCLWRRHCEPALQAKIEAFVSHVQNRLPAPIKARFPQVEVKAGCMAHWVLAGAGVTPEGSKAGLSLDMDMWLEMRGWNLECYTYIKGGSSTEPDTTVGRLSAAIRNRPEEFIHVLSRLGPEYTLTLYARDGQGSREPRAEISLGLGLFARETCLFLQAALDRIPLPGIEVHRSLGYHRVEDFTGEALIDWAVAALTFLSEVSTFF